MPAQSLPIEILKPSLFTSAPILGANPASQGCNARPSALGSTQFVSRASSLKNDLRMTEHAPATVACPDG